MLEFWYDFASTYAHIAAQRIGSLANAAGVNVRWRPFLLGPIFAAQGWATSPFTLYPAKGRYMWRDIERLSAAANLPLTKPDPFPANSMLAARVALQGIDQDWIAPFSVAVFRAQFCEGANIADVNVVRTILVGQKLDAERLLEGARSEQVKGRLRIETDAAARLGVFGAPTFVVDGELFWGNDRLEEALRWADRPWA